VPIEWTTRSIPDYPFIDEAQVKGSIMIYPYWKGVENAGGCVYDPTGIEGLDIMIESNYDFQRRIATLRGLVAGNNITLAYSNNGRCIIISSIDTDIKVKVTENDTLENYLNEKIVVEGNITKEVIVEGAEEKLKLKVDEDEWQNDGLRETVTELVNRPPTSPVCGDGWIPFDAANIRLSDTITGDWIVRTLNRKYEHPTYGNRAKDWLLFRPERDGFYDINVKIYLDYLVDEQTHPSPWQLYEQRGMLIVERIINAPFSAPEADGLPYYYNPLVHKDSALGSDVLHNSGNPTFDSIYAILDHKLQNYDVRTYIGESETEYETRSNNILFLQGEQPVYLKEGDTLIIWYKLYGTWRNLRKDSSGDDILFHKDMDEYGVKTVIMPELYSLFSANWLGGKAQYSSKTSLFNIVSKF